MASLMARAASAEVREALLQSLLRTQSAQALAQLAASGRVLDTLDSWARCAHPPPHSRLCSCRGPDEAAGNGPEGWSSWTPESFSIVQQCCKILIGC